MVYVTPEEVTIGFWMACEPDSAASENQRLKTLAFVHVSVKLMRYELPASSVAGTPTRIPDFAPDVVAVKPCDDAEVNVSNAVL